MSKKAWSILYYKVTLKYILCPDGLQNEDIEVCYSTKKYISHGGHNVCLRSLDPFDITKLL